jgi:Zn finger protein HypA/HybF involved in hydrogenase expression
MYIICDDCGWSGHESELFCSEDDANSDLPLDAIAFNLCPNCDSENLTEIDEEDDEDL